MVRLFAAATPPTDSDDASALTVGVEVQVSTAADATAILFFQPTTGTVSTVNRPVALYEVVGAFEGTAVYTGTMTVTGSGWQTHTLTTPVTLDPAKRYRAAVHHPAGGYVATSLYFDTGDGAAGVTNGILSAPNSTNATGGTQGSYRAGSPIEFPASEFNAANYWVDLEVGEVTAPPPIAGFAVHDGAGWVQGYGMAHDGAQWLPVDPTGV